MVEFFNDSSPRGLLNNRFERISLHGFDITVITTRDLTSDGT